MRLRPTFVFGLLVATPCPAMLYPQALEKAGTNLGVKGGTACKFRQAQTTTFMRLIVRLAQ